MTNWTDIGIITLIRDSTGCITSTEVASSTVKIRLWHSWRKIVSSDKNNAVVNSKDLNDNSSTVA